MTDAEISRRLALAIGWPNDSVYTYTSPESGCQVWRMDGVWCRFDYRDPAVIWPIAEHFGAFPMKNAKGNGWVAITEEAWLSGKEFAFEKADTTAKAVALAVIAAKGKA